MLPLLGLTHDTSDIFFRQDHHLFGVLEHRSKRYIQWCIDSNDVRLLKEFSTGEHYPMRLAFELTIVL
jgi:hypothetical protein